MSQAEDFAALVEIVVAQYTDPRPRTAAELRREIDPRALADPEAEKRTLGMVARACGVTPDTVQAWEEGSAVPSTAHLAVTWLRFLRQHARMAPAAQFAASNGAHS